MVKVYFDRTVLFIVLIFLYTQQSESNVEMIG